MATYWSTGEEVDDAEVPRKVTQPGLAEDIEAEVKAAAARLRLQAGWGSVLPQRPTVSSAELASLVGCNKKTIRRVELRGILVRIKGFRHPALYTRASAEEWLAGGGGEAPRRRRARRR